MSSTHETLPSTLPSPSESQIVALLQAHIPLSLLLDLAETDPHSRELYAVEQAC